MTVVPGTVTGSPARMSGDAGHVLPLLPGRLGAAEDDVADLGRVDLRHLAEHVADAVRGQIVGAAQVERAAERLRQRSARAGNDDGFSHHNTPS